MTGHPAEVRRPPVVRVSLLVLCLLALGVGTAWLYFPMRAVMDVGGYCAEGGPYVIETHCPEGSTLFLTLGVPLWMAGAFIGFVAATVSAPFPIFPGWALLFGALGWNFMDYALHADPSGAIVPSWLICGIMFWLMALPAVVIFVGWPAVSARFSTSRSPRDLRAPRPIMPGWAWVPIYMTLLATGFWLGSLMAR